MPFPAFNVRIDNVINLTFGGGGIRGLGHIGALRALVHDSGLNLDNIRRISASSAGAIIGGLVAVGYSPEELEVIFKDLNFSDFLDADQESLFDTKDRAVAAASASTHVSRPSKASAASAEASVASKDLLIETSMAGINLATKYGLFKGEKFRLFYEGLIAKKIQEQEGRVLPFLTYMELHQLAIKNPKYKDLYVTGVNLNTQMVDIFSWETTPNAIVSDTVRCSMSIPGLFIPHQVHEKRQQPRPIAGGRPWIATSSSLFSGSNIEAQRTLSSNRDLYVDGGLLTNVAFNVFDYDIYADPDIEADAQTKVKAFNSRTLVLRLVSEGVEDALREGRALFHNQISSPVDFVMALYGAARLKEDSDFRLNEDAQRTVFIAVRPASFAIRVSPEEKEGMLQAGMRAVRETVAASPAHRVS